MWCVQGLPTDELSLQNASIVMNTNRYPLLVDPQGQGKRWLASRTADAGVCIAQQSDKQFRHKLEVSLYLTISLYRCLGMQPNG